MRIAENIFESLPDEEGKAFFAALPDAVGGDGKDLTRVHWAFLASELRLLPQHECIDTVIAGMDLLVAGGEWSIDAADAACAATRVSHARHASRSTNTAACAATAAARAAYYAAHADNYTATRAAADAVCATADVTRSSDYAARIRQRDSLLEIIKQAPMGDQA